MGRNIILFFYPDAKGQYVIPPYAFLYLERTIRDLPLRVVILDETLDHDWEQQVAQLAPEVLLAGTSVVLGDQISGAVRFSERVKQSGDIPVLWGGWFPTWKPAVCLQEPYIDYVITGQGESAFSQLVRHLLEQGNDLQSILKAEIAGLLCKNNTGAVVRNHQEMQGFEVWPEVDYRLIDIRKYFNVNKINGNTVFRYFATAGCPNLCNFCFLSRAWKGQWFAKPIATVISDIRYFLSVAPEIQYIVFEDNNFFYDRDYVMNFCKALIDENIHIRWSASTHIGHFLETFSDDDLNVIKKSGCASIASGAESGDQHILDLLNKNLQVADIIKFVKMVSKHQIASCFSFMVLFPGDPGRDLQKTLKLVMRLIQIDPSFQFFLNIYAPTRRNVFLEKAEEYGYRIPGSMSDFLKFSFDLKHMPWITPALALRMKVFAHFYFRFFSGTFIFNPGGMSPRAYVFALLWWPLIRLRFLFRSTAFPFGGSFYNRFILAEKFSSSPGGSVDKSVLVQYTSIKG